MASLSANEEPWTIFERLGIVGNFWLWLQISPIIIWYLEKTTYSVIHFSRLLKIEDGLMFVCRNSDKCF